MNKRIVKDEDKLIEVVDKDVDFKRPKKSKQTKTKSKGSKGHENKDN